MNLVARPIEPVKVLEEKDGRLTGRCERGRGGGITSKSRALPRLRIKSG